jgi:hypothetical protein
MNLIFRTISASFIFGLLSISAYAQTEKKVVVIPMLGGSVGMSFYKVVATVEVSGASIGAGASPRCAVGDAVTGGGHRFTFDGGGIAMSNIAAIANYPLEAKPASSLGEGWRVSVWSNRSVNETNTMEVFAICANRTP